MAAPTVPRATYYLPRHLGATIDHPQFRRDQAKYNRERAADRMFPLVLPDCVDEGYREYFESHARAHLQHVRNLIIKHELRPGTPEQLRRGRKRPDVGGDAVARPEPVHLSSLPRRVYDWFRWGRRGSSIEYMEGEESLRYDSSVEGSSTHSLGRASRRGGSRLPVLDLEAQVGVDEPVRPGSAASLRSSLKVSDAGSEAFVSCPSSPYLGAAPVADAAAVVVTAPVPMAVLTPPAVLVVPSSSTSPPAASSSFRSSSSSSPSPAAAEAAADAAATTTSTGGTGHDAAATTAPAAAEPSPSSSRLTSRALRWMQCRTWLADTAARVGRGARSLGSAVAACLRPANLAHYLVWWPLLVVCNITADMCDAVGSCCGPHCDEDACAAGTCCEIDEDLPWYRPTPVNYIVLSRPYALLCMPCTNACLVSGVECCLNNPCWECCCTACCPV